MSDITYFILAMVFNHWRKVLLPVLILLLLTGWSDLFACGTKLADPVIIYCTGCK